MIGEVIKEYLVSLGVQIDKPGFNQMQTTLNQTSGVVSSATSGWAKDFVKAGAIISTALASVSASIVGVMSAAAKQDLAIEKYSRSMLVSKSAAMEMKTAIDALGESIQDIQLTPELLGRYRALVTDGRSMKIGGDYEGTMKNFRDLIFEFTRLKQEASYALQWVGYYLMKHLAKPLADAKATFKSFNDNLIKTMPVWTEKVARALVYIINIGKHFLDLLKAIGKTVYDVWDAFPRGIKIATAALAGFFMLLRASPLGKMVALVSSLLLLVDDYFGYMEGKQAAMGPIWDKLNAYWERFVGYLKSAKESVFSLAGKVSDWIQEVRQSDALSEFVTLVKDLSTAFYDLGSGIVEFVTAAFKDLLEAFKDHDMASKFTDLMERLKEILWGILGVLKYCIQTVAEWYKEIAKSDELKDFIDAIVELSGALMDLFNALVDLVMIAFSGFFGEMEKTQKAYTFRDAVKAVVGMITAMIRAISDVVKGLTQFFKMMTDNRLFKEFWRGMGQAVKGFADIVLGAIAMVGRLGQALLALVRGDYKKAAKLAGDAFSGKAEANGENSSWQSGRIDGLSAGEAAAEPYIQEAARGFNINPNLLRALVKQESGFDPDAESAVGAIGYSQLMPETAEELGVNPWDPRENILGGAKYLRQQLDTFNGDVKKALAAYNAGPGAVIEYNGIPPYEETQNYVISVLANLKEYESRTTYDRPKDDNTGKTTVQDPPPDQPAFINPPEDLRDITWWDRVKEEAREDWEKFLDFFTPNPPPDQPEGRSGSSLVRPSSYFASAFNDADPMIVNSLLQGGSLAYAQGSSGSVINNVTYQVDVGGVEVKNTNATAEDIGREVGNQTASSIQDRATYVLQNRALNGVQV